MKIIKAGSILAHKEYEATCYKCSAVIQFKYEEASLNHDEDEGDYLSILCPTEGCNKIINVNVSRSMDR